FTTHSGDGRFNIYPMRAVHDASGFKYIRNLHPDWLFTSHVTFQLDRGGFWDSWLDAAVAGDAKALELVRDHQVRPPEELYDIREDPYELNNLAEVEEHAKKLNQLRADLDGWIESTGDELASYGPAKQRPKSTSPNILMVLIDDMGFADLSCFGGPTETQHIDQLASEGIRFGQFYVNSPICSPSRVALQTGRYPFHYRISSYLARRQLNKEREMPNWLSVDAPSLPRQLRRIGYYTGHFGKWHMGGQRDVDEAPLITEYGFDRSLTNFEGLGPRVLGWKTEANGKRSLHALGSDKLKTGPVIEAERHQVTDAFIDRAIKHIDHAGVLERPFYINLWFDDVHGPFYPDGDASVVQKLPQRERYRLVLDQMDESLGRIFERIQSDEKLRDNTLIVLLSDNGHDVNAGSGGELRGGKTWLYEGGIRSPLIVWGPGIIAPDAIGSVNNQSVGCSLDLNRSLYTIAGTNPENPDELDGEDISATLLGKEHKSRQDFIAWRRPIDRPGFSHGLKEDNPDLAIRRGRWKYLVNRDGSNAQLYDLIEDAAESHNLAHNRKELVNSLDDSLRKWDDHFPKTTPKPLRRLPRP
ncbi:MAG: sulfatase-like hydrolase/transferase, partial [Planctomycetota bacterium]